VSEDDQSEYYKWRCLIALAHVDGRLMRDEQEFLKAHIQENAPEALQPRLMDEMTEDMFGPKKDVDIYFHQISRPQDRVDLLKMAYDLFWADGNLDQTEKAAFDFIIEEIKQDDESFSVLKQSVESWGGGGLTEVLKGYLD